MALSFDLTKIKNSDTVCFDKKQMRPVTNALIWGTIIAELGTITEQNASEFYLRLKLADAACNNEYKDVTAKDVRDHIGLHCNVADLSFAKFSQKLKRMVERTAHDMDRARAETKEKLAA